jgi:hypothetical protein
MPKDELGLYYYPVPGNKKVRMYVRNSMHGVEFRLWNADHPEVWEKHEWIPIDVVQRATNVYQQERNAEKNPMDLYDLEIARRLLRDENKEDS